MIVSVDFDGTITQSSDPTNSGFNKIRPDCKRVMDVLSCLGVEFVLLTGRKPEWVSEAVKLCKKWNLPIDTSTPNTKRICDVYIDDKNLGCVGIDWKVIFSMLYAQISLSELGGKDEESTFIFRWNG